MVFLTFAALILTGFILVLPLIKNEIKKTGTVVHHIKPQ